jgi:hypothetical protein
MGLPLKKKQKRRRSRQQRARGRGALQLVSSSGASLGEAMQGVMQQQRPMVVMLHWMRIRSRRHSSQHQGVGLLLLVAGRQQRPEKLLLMQLLVENEPLVSEGLPEGDS